MKIMNITAWACLAIYAITAASIYIPGRNATGDRAVGLVIPFLMAPAVIVFGAVLVFAQYRQWSAAVAIIAILLTLPILVFGRTIVGNVLYSYSSKRLQELRGQFRDPVLAEMGSAIRNSDHVKLKALFAGRSKIDWSAKDRAGFTLFGAAVEVARRSTAESPHCLRVLVEAGAPLQDDPRVLSGLITSLDERPFRLEILELLLRAGANPNEKDIDGVPALMGVFMEAEKAKVLLNAGAELASLRRNDVQYQGWDPLMYAAVRARWELALLYLARGCDPNYQAPDGKSALSIANEQEESIGRTAFLSALAAAKAKKPNP
jgi:hypothetical protein